MKFNLCSILLALLATVAFTSCDKLEEADDVKFDVTFKVPQAFSVSETAPEPTNPYVSAVSTMDVDEPQFDKYKDQIKDVTITKIEYTITDFEGDNVTLNLGEAIFFEVGQNLSTGKIARIENKVLSNHTGELQADAAALDAIEKIILEDGEVLVAARANVSDAPFYFNIQVTVHATITANAVK